jgi:peptidoglycan/xylan/chitin deacetylase (PgdA/CDA1 family)
MSVLAVAGTLAAVMLFLFYASYSIRLGVYVKALCKNPDAGKAVALTFDDCPDAIQTPKVLDVLKKYNIKACFFCIGSKIAGNEAIIRRIKAEGHLLGNHSYSHSGKFPLYSAKKMFNDVAECSQKIERITSIRIQLFRPPFGVTNPTVAQTVKKHGYITIGWNIRTFDTCRSTGKILKRVERRLSPGSVILLHDNLKTSDSTLEKIVALISSKGYRFVRVDELFGLNLEA